VLADAGVEQLPGLAAARAEDDAKAREPDRALEEADALAASLAETKALEESAARAREAEFEKAQAESRARADALAQAEAQARADHERELAAARAEAEARTLAETRAMAEKWAAREREAREKEDLPGAASAGKAFVDEEVGAASKAAELEPQPHDEESLAGVPRQTLNHGRGADEPKSQAGDSALARNHLASPAPASPAEGLTSAPVEPASASGVIGPTPPKAKRSNRAKNPKAPGRAKPARPPGPPSRKNLLASLMLVLVLILAGGGTWIYLGSQLGRGKSSARPTINAAAMAQIREKKYLESGWQDEALELLSRFLDADSAAGKAACSLRGSELLTAMDLFYGGGRIDDSDTALSGFSAEPLPPDDQRRGIFMMRYDQPPQFEMRDFFRPLAPLEVQYGLQEPDLLLGSLARAGNFTSEPVKVHVFFKRTPDGLRLDWETFIQTKHRTFREFTELPDPGRSGMFRLFVVEDVPEKGREQRGMRTYRMVDPAHKSDSVRVDVPVDSELGRSLSILNWRGVKDARPTARTATLELEWTDEASPQLTIKRFICWEFLGIGGQAITPQVGK